MERAKLAVAELDKRLKAAQSSGSSSIRNSGASVGSSEVRREIHSLLGSSATVAPGTGISCSGQIRVGAHAGHSMPRPSSEWRRPRRRTRLKAASSKLTRWAGKSPSLHRLQDAPRRGRGARTGDIGRASGPVRGTQPENCHRNCHRTGDYEMVFGMIRRTSGREKLKQNGHNVTPWYEMG
jgi:hypothetical protein